MIMQQMRVRMDEWFFTQAIVGFKKILEDYGEKVQTKHDGIIVEKRHLEVLPDAYFTYYLEQYSVAQREERYVRARHKRFREGDRNAKRELNSRINETKKSTDRYFKETDDGKKLGSVADLYRKEKEYSPKMDDWIDDFIEALYSQDINEKLTSNFFKTVILNPFFGQVSFLNVTHNKKSIKEQKAIFKKDLITPILEEWELIQALEVGNEEKIYSLLQKLTNHTPLNSIKRKLRKKSIDEMNDYIQQEVHRCSLTDFPLALQSFDERVFSPLSLSISNARNMSWNADSKSFLPISSLARLLMFCSQAGGTDSQGKSVFIHYAGTFDEIYQTNKFYGDLKENNQTFDQIIFDLVREQKVKANFLKNRYVIYEYESNYQSKRTLLDYMIMTPNLMRLFADNSNLFNYMHYSVKSEVIRYLLRGIDTKRYINEQLRLKIKDNYPVLDVIQLIQIRHLNECYKREVLHVDSNIEKRRVWALVKSGEQVKYKIGVSKAQGIAYRLLNSVRSNDKNTFMDTVMRVYISSDLEMPALLLEALHEEKMDFATVGNAWIAGLVSKPNDQEKGESKVE